MLKKQSYILLVILSVLLISGCSDQEPQLTRINEDNQKSDVSYEQNEDTLLEESALNDENSATRLFVHITGQVNSPGVYELEAGSRLYDAVMLAGGFTDQADTEYANLAEVIEDGRKYQIYSVEETSEMNEMSGTDDTKAHYDADGLLDINKATAQEFMGLSGIGKTKAEAIVAYRDVNGEFSVKEDIKKVSGIGDGLYQNIEEYITVR